MFYYCQSITKIVLFSFIRPMVFGIKNGLTFESQYILSTMTCNASSQVDGESLPLRVNINSIDNNTQSSDGRQENHVPEILRTPLLNSSVRTPMHVQIEYPDNINRKRRNQSLSQHPSKKNHSNNSKSVIEQFRDEYMEDDVLLSQVADFQVNDEPNIMSVDNGVHSSIGLSDTGRIFARCYALPTEKSPKKGKVIVYDSDGLGDDSD